MRSLFQNTLQEINNPDFITSSGHYLNQKPIQKYKFEHFDTDRYFHQDYAGPIKGSLLRIDKSILNDLKRTKNIEIGTSKIPYDDLIQRPSFFQTRYDTITPSNNDGDGYPDYIKANFEDFIQAPDSNAFTDPSKKLQNELYQKQQALIQQGLPSDTIKKLLLESILDKMRNVELNKQMDAQGVIQGQNAQSLNSMSTSTLVDTNKLLQELLNKVMAGQKIMEPAAKNLEAILGRMKTARGQVGQEASGNGGGAAAQRVGGPSGSQTTLDTFVARGTIKKGDGVSEKTQTPPPPKPVDGASAATGATPPVIPTNIPAGAKKNVQSVYKVKPNGWYALDSSGNVILSEKFETQLQEAFNRDGTPNLNKNKTPLYMTTKYFNNDTLTGLLDEYVRTNKTLAQMRDLLRRKGEK